MNVMLLVFVNGKLGANLTLHSLSFPFPKATFKVRSLAKSKGINLNSFKDQQAKAEDVFIVVSKGCKRGTENKGC